MSMIMCFCSFVLAVSFLSFSLFPLCERLTEHQDVAMKKLGDHTKVMASSVTALLRTIQNVENEKDRVVTAIDSASDAIRSELSYVCAFDFVFSTVNATFCWSLT